jgi:hypothetical protein
VRDRLTLRHRDDPATGYETDDASPIGEFVVRGEEPYFDGPVCARVAVIDVDATAGTLRQGARFRPARPKAPARYDLGEAAIDADASVADLGTDAFVQVSSFATVLRTVHFFEGPDALGRRVEWAFPSRQLLVVPRAGVMANAFYDRDSGSLQFFSYPGENGELIDAVLSADVVAHETAHAVLDGVAPDLYDAITPQSLAIHEAIADLTAICLRLTNESLVFSAYALWGGSVDPLAVLSHVAEEFGADIRGVPGELFLRAAANRRTMATVDRTEPHSLSEVLSGAAYDVFVRLRAELRSRSSVEPGDEYKADISSTLAAGRRTTRLVFGALDFLAPGEISFADVARAIVACHRAAGRHGPEAGWLIEALADRGALSSAEFAQPARDLGDLGLDAEQVERLIADDAFARDVADRNRRALGIPARRRIEVLPRHELRGSGVAVTRGSRRRGGRHDWVVFRVCWRTTEEHDLGAGFGRRWSVRVGTTAILDRHSGRVLSILSTDASESQAADRDALLRRLANDGTVVPRAVVGPDGKPLTDSLAIVRVGGAQQLTGGGRLLHMIGTG